MIVSLLERTGTLPEAGASENIINMINEIPMMKFQAPNWRSFYQFCDLVGGLAERRRNAKVGWAVMPNARMVKSRIEYSFGF